MSLIQTMTQKKYDDMLYNALDLLKTLPFKQGGEGRAYFFGDYVIKEFKPTNDSMFNETFSMYCAELQKFNKKGFNIPKIYSWLSVELCAGKYKHYILQEKIVGRELYCGTVFNSHNYCYDNLHKNWVNNTRHDLPESEEEFRNEAYEFVEDYVFMNEFLEAIPDENLGKLACDCYHLCTDGQFSISDCFPSNFIANLEKQTITQIDNQCLNRNRYGLTDKDCISYFVYDFLDVFLNNKHVKNLLAHPSLNDKTENRREFIRLIKANDKLYKAVLTKVVRLLNKFCEKPKINSHPIYNKLCEDIEKSFIDGQSAVKIIQQIKTEF